MLVGKRWPATTLLIVVMRMTFGVSLCWARKLRATNNSSTARVATPSAKNRGRQRLVVEVAEDVICNI
jgi:hypothetical protein